MNRAIPLLIVMVFIGMIVPSSALGNPSNNHTKVQPTVPDFIKKLVQTTPKKPLIRVPVAAIANLPLPSNAIRTSDGGYVTPLRTTDDLGRKLHGHSGGSGTVIPENFKLPVALVRGPTPGIYQEGEIWKYNYDPSMIGLSEEWTFPSVNLNGASVGLYFNPVNMYYPIAQPYYNFFQVDYGLGNNGLNLGWFATVASIMNNGTGQYYYFNMNGVPAIPGDTYKVDAAVEPSPLSNPPRYVVQITLGSQYWLNYTNLNFNPSAGQINGLSEFQDEYIATPGTVTMSQDTNAQPGIIKNVNNTLVIDRTLVYGMSPLHDLLPNPISTWDILSQYVINSTAFFNAPLVSSWPSSIPENLTISDNLIVSSHYCTPPTSGDWTITSSCTLQASVASPANVAVQAGAILTIPNGLRLNIDLTHHHLLVKSGGGVLFKAGGAIN